MHSKITHLVSVVLSVAVLILCAQVALAQDTTAEALVEKYIEAMGGREAFSKLKSRIMKGEFAIPDYGMFAPMETYMVPPDKSYFTIDTGGGGTAASGIIGDVVWDVNPMVGPRIMQGEERAARIRQAEWDQLLNWKKHFKEARLGDDKEIKGRMCAQVILTPNEGSPVTVFLDRETNLIAEIQSSVGGVTSSTALSDYREVDSVKIPFQVDISADQFSIEIRVESVEHNKDIPDSRFEPPAEIKALIDQ